MLENLSALAIVPKAKAIAARRLTHNDYLELMRKRSVIEVMATLQSIRILRTAWPACPKRTSTANSWSRPSARISFINMNP